MSLPLAEGQGKERLMGIIGELLKAQESKMTLRFQLGSTEVLGVYLGGLRKREEERKAWEMVNQESSGGKPKIKLFFQPRRHRCLLCQLSPECRRMLTQLCPTLRPCGL